MTLGTVVSIHQPNFLPWLGFFHKLARSDVFILLDTVDFSRGSRTNRVQVLAADTPSWLTVPVRRPEHGEPRIVDARIDDSRPWRRKALRTLEINYGPRRGFEETFALVEPVLSERTDRLAALNEAGIRRIAAALSLDAGKLVRASDLSAAGSSSELLASLVARGWRRRLSQRRRRRGVPGGRAVRAPGNRGSRPGVQAPRLRSGDPRAPVHGLSVVDAMMNLGASDTQRLLT